MYRGNSGDSGSGGNEEEEEEPSAFVGTWDYTEIELKNGVLSTQGQEVGSFSGNGISIVGEVIIMENPNTYSTELSFTANVDAQIFGQTQNQQLPVDRQVSSGTWTESNGEITLTDDNGQDLGIISSSSSRIVFTGNFDNEIPITQQFVLDANSDVEFTITK